MSISATPKLTKKDHFINLIDVLESVGDNDELITFCENEIAAIDRKAAKAKEYAAKKKGADTELFDTLKDCLTDTYRTVDQIMEDLTDVDTTKSKVVYRLNALYKEGFAEKTQVTIPGENGSKSRKVVAYKIAAAD